MSGHVFSPAGFFAFRAPLLPFEVLEALAAGASAPGAADDPARLPQAVAEDRSVQGRRLRELARRADIREALFLASPDLDDALDAWFRDPDGDKGERAGRAVWKYVSRMTARASPFGLFAASGVGTIGEETRLVVGPRAAWRRRSRLDMGFLFTLVAALGRDPSIRGLLRYRPNSTLYRHGNRLRYVECRVTTRGPSYHLADVEEDAPLCRVLDGARNGATLGELAVLVDAEIPPEVARTFVSEAVDAQLLVPDLPLCITTSDPLVPLVEALRTSGAPDGVASALEGAAAELAAIDRAGLGNPPAAYRALAARLEALPVRPELPRLFQVDSVRLAPRAQLGERVLAEIGRGARLLQRMTPSLDSRLKAFAEAFEERYGEREVPLLEALDEESGIGFPAHAGENAGYEPLLAGVRFVKAPGAGPPWTPRHRHLLTLLSAALSAGAEEIVLSDEDVEALSVPDPLPLPGSFSAHVHVAARSDEALDRGDFRVVLDGVGGPSGVRPLGRFCPADRELTRLVEDHLRAEEALEPDALFAEVVHLPDGRTGNVLTRPPLREHEIPFLGDAGVPEERRIPVGDLAVSLGDGRIRLRSLRLGRRVVPRLTAAHDDAHLGLGLYRFLCALQNDGTAGGSWDWGPLASAAFLPRVRHGRVVLCPATWNLGKRELSDLCSARGGERFRAVSRLRERRRLPRFVRLADAQDALLVDLDSVLAVDAFVPLAKERDGVSLREMLPTPEELCARGPEGRFVHDVLVPFLQEPAPPEPGPLAFGRPGGSLRRSFPPGSEWLYVKLYGGSVTLDRLLGERLGDEIQALVSPGAVDRWFFVRYADPRSHLRIRLHGDPRTLRESAWPRLAQTARDLVEERLLWKVQLDTYEPEVERYGGPEAMPVAEELFRIDSEAVLDLLRRLEPGDAGEEERWRLALAGTVRLLADLGLSDHARLDLVSRLRASCGRAANEDATLRRSLGECFRRREAEVTALVDLAAEPRAGLGPGLAILARRSQRAVPVVASLLALEESGRLGVSRASLAASLVHLFLNRLFATRQAEQELVVSDLLRRALRSRLYRDAGSGEGGSRGPGRRPGST